MNVKLKIGRYEYDITENDEFMDNGNCVQLLSQSKENSSWGFKPNPVLSKRAIKELSVFNRVELPNDYGPKVSVFKLEKEKI